MEEISKYEKYKDSGVEWIGEIPEHWDVKKIKHTSYVKGRVGWKGLKSSEFLTDGFSYLVTGTDFKNDKIDWENCYHIDEERYNEDPYIQLQDEDLLITKDGTIGKLAVVTNLNKPACLNSGIFVVRSTKENFTTRFLLWVLKSSSFTDFNGLTSYGSTIQHLYQNVFVEFAFAFPPLTTQISIADYLQTKTAEIDSIIANKQKLIALYEEEKQAIINQAVTKGIDLNAKMKDSGVEWLGEIPEHWDVKKLKYEAEMISGYAFSSKDFITDGIQLIKISNLYQNEFCLDRQPTFLPESFLEKYKNWCVHKEDILMSMTGTLGKRDYGFAVQVKDEGPFFLNQRVSKIKFSSRISPDFGLFLLRSDYFLNFLFLEPSGTKQGNFSNEQVLNQYICYPPLNEQQTIVTRIRDEIINTSNFIKRIKKQIDLLQEYRTTLISEVVTGKIKVPNTIEA